MARQAKVLAAKPDDLSLVPRTPWWKERTSSCRVSSDLHLHTLHGTHTYTCPLIHGNVIKNNKEKEMEGQIGDLSRFS